MNHPSVQPFSDTSLDADSTATGDRRKHKRFLFPIGLVLLGLISVLTGLAPGVYGADPSDPAQPVLLMEFTTASGGHNQADATSAVVVAPSDGSSQTADQLPGAPLGSLVHSAVPLAAEPISATLQTNSGALQRYTIAGLVQDNQGIPVSDVELFALSRAFNFDFDTTGADGRYLLSIAADTYRVGASKRGYLSPPDQTITVPPDQTAVNFVMARCAVDNNEPGAPCFHWQGATNQSRPISFDLEASETTLRNFALQTSVTVGGCSGTLTVTVLSPVIIQADRFAIDGTFAANGQFTGRTTASGNYSFNRYYIPNCGYFSSSGSWNASGSRPGPIPTPQITHQPSDATIRVGETATLVVTTTAGSAAGGMSNAVDNLTWQWYEGASGDVSRPIAGAVGQQLTTPPLNANMTYWVRATHESGGYVDSQTAAVTVVTHYSVTVPATVEAGRPFSIAIAALDSAGNVAPGYRGISQVESIDGQGQLALQHPFTDADNGVANLTVVLWSRGPHQLTVKDTTVLAITASVAIDVQPSPDEKLLLTLWIVR